MSQASSRRSFMSLAAAGLAGTKLAAGGPAHAAQGGGSSRDEEPSTRENSRSLAPGDYPVKAISSANGLDATRLAYERMMTGDDPLDAGIAGVNLVEDDPEETSVGYGGLPNEDGVVELDAAVMHGPTHLAGAVAALRNIRHPSRVAKQVMETTDHVLLVGEGALRFARALGFVEENLLTEKAREIWLRWKRTHSDNDDWLPPSGAANDDTAAWFKSRPTGTIHLSAMNARGEISCLTSTSGLAFKIAGRVGDSPIVGAGLFVDNEIGSCGSTGRGEANLENLSSAMAVELMRGGASPLEAGMEILRRIARHAQPRLLDADGRPTFDIKFYLLAKNGAHAGVSMWGPANFAVTDETGTRHEACQSLFSR